jgi:hypothetical protein
MTKPKNEHGAPGLPDPELAPGLPADDLQPGRLTHPDALPDGTLSRSTVRRLAGRLEALVGHAPGQESSEAPEMLTGATAGADSVTWRTCADGKIRRWRETADGPVPFTEDPNPPRVHGFGKGYAATIEDIYTAMKSDAPHGWPSPLVGVSSPGFQAAIVSPACDACGDDPTEWPCVSCHRGSGG